MDSIHNQASGIASVVCPLCRKFSPKTPIRNVMQRDAARVDFLYQLNRAMGGRKALLQNKKDYVTRWCLHTEQGFTIIAAYGIELRCRYTDGTVRYWSGSGAVKRRGAEEAAEWVRDLKASGVDLPESHDGDGTDFQIDITGIWDQIFQYLEKPYG